MRTFRDTLEKLSLEPPLRYGISSRGAFPELDPLRYLELLFGTSAHILQWREKDLPTSQNCPLIVRGAELARAGGKLFLVNSRVEEALAGGGSGAHLTSEQNLEEARRLRAQAGAADFILGKSVHSFAEAERAEEEGADYLLLGPVFEPVSKSSSAVPLGLSSFREAVQALYTPIFALGGIVPANFDQVLRTGAVGVSGISWLQDEVRSQLK